MASQAARSTVLDRSRSPHRVLHVESNEDGTVGGSHRALVDLVRAVERTRYEPVVLFNQGNRHVPDLRAAKVEVHVYETERASERALRARGGLPKYVDFLQAIRRRADLLRRLKIGLLHLNNSPQVGYDDWVPAARLAGVPVVAFAMGDANLRPWLARAVARRLDHVIAISNYMADAMRRVGVREERLSTVPLGVNIAGLRAAAQGNRAELRASLGVGPGDVLAVMVGNIRHWKGQHVVVEAFGLLPADVQRRLKVRFVGATAEDHQQYEMALRARIAEAGAEQSVQLVGSRNDVPAVYAAADLAVHASVLPEPFGLVVPEAMVQGIPVIASKFGGPGEVLSAATGRLFDPASPKELAAHLEEMVRNDGVRHALGRAAATAVQAYSVEAMVRGVTGVYDRVLR